MRWGEIVSTQRLRRRVPLGWWAAPVASPPDTGRRGSGPRDASPPHPAGASGVIAPAAGPPVARPPVAGPPVAGPPEAGSRDGRLATRLRDAATAGRRGLRWSRSSWVDIAWVAFV